MPLDDDTTLSDDDALQCIEDCQRCHDECLRTAMQQCLEMGGEHASRDHLSLMLTCAELCQTAANAMLRGRPASGHLPGMWRGLSGLRRQLRGAGRHGRLRRSLPHLR